jgi:hypothetical protein
MVVFLDPSATLKENFENFCMNFVYHAPMKTCYTCLAEMPNDEFSKNSSAQDGLSIYCRDCTRSYASQWRKEHPRHVDVREPKVKFNRDEYAKKYRELNKDRLRVQQENYYVANKERCLASSRQWHKEHPDYNKNHYMENREQHITAVKRWKQENPDYARNYYLKNKAKCIEQAMEWWRNNKHSRAARNAEHKILRRGRPLQAWADIEKIEAFYKSARDLTLSTKIPHVVDHIYPINGKTVCGLHVEQNLQVITHSANSRKGNLMPNFEDDGLDF